MPTINRNRVDFNGQTLIDLTNDTVTPETLLSGVTAHDASGASIVGTSNVSGMIAEPFSNSVAYSIGDLVIYNNVLYCFTSSHSAGPWNSSEVSSVTVADELDKKLDYGHGTYYVVGTQTATTGAWTGNLPDVDALYNGLTIDYWLPFAGSGNATLNLTLKDGSTTGAVNCYWSGTSRLTTHIGANTICRLIYQTVIISGTSYTGWWLLKAYDTNDSAAYFYRGAGNLIADSVIYRYQLLFSVDETTVTPLNNVSNTTGTTKTMLTNATFDPFGEIFYWNSTSTVNAGENVGNTARWTSNFDLRYTFNCGQTLTAHKPLYLKVLLQSDGKVKIADSMPITNNLPATNDGILYIFLGRTYSTYQLYLYPQHPIYYHDGTGIKEYVKPHTHDDRYYTESEIDTKLAPMYGYCETAAGTVEKTVTINNFTLVTGRTIFVKFKNANSATNPTLNVSSTGAKRIYRYGTTSAGTTSGSNGWQADSVLTLTYDGTGWIEHLWQNNTYNMANNSLGGGNFTVDSVVYRYQILVHLDRETLSPFNNDNNVTATTKTILTDIEFDPFSQIYYYDSTTTISADGSISAGALYYSRNDIDLRYSFNIDNTTDPLTIHKDVYMKVTPLANGKVKIASAMPLVQQLPVTNDGYWYIFLGRANRTYGLCVYPEKPIFYHDGSGIRQKFNPYLQNVLDGKADTADINSILGWVGLVYYNNGIYVDPDQGV